MADNSPAAPVLEVRGLGKRFGSLQALEGVTLNVRAGKILGMVGPNGAGKSTLINIISGLIRADEGEIWWLGSPMHRAAPHEIAELGVARTFQIVKPLRDLTVVENVMVGALFGRRRIQATREAREIAYGALERVGLVHRAEAECRDISTGETKKMDMARAIAMAPELLLLDEPLAGVGVREADGLIALIVELAQQGTAIVLVEHVMRAVWKISDSVVVLNYGRKIAEGPPHEVADNEEVIAAYLGERYTQQFHHLPHQETVPAADGSPALSGPAAVPLPTEREEVAQEAAAANGAPPDAALVVRHLTTGYTDVPLIRDLNIYLGQEEIVALLGANGSGKTTILRAIMSLLPAWEGRVLLEGSDVSDLPVHERTRRGLALVPAGRVLFYGLSVTENLKMGGYLDWKPRVLAERMDTVFSLFPKLAERRNHLAGKLSGGEQQMVAIGRALMSRPRVLLIDELSLGLAPNVVEQLMQIVERIREQFRIPILFVEQDVLRAVELADRAYVLEQGQVVLEGQPRSFSQDRRLIQAYMGIT